MAHKTLIGGTAYEISGGKTLVNGTAYSIDKGKTLVGGTAYEVGFAPSEAIVKLKVQNGGNYSSITTATNADINIDGVFYYTTESLVLPIGTVIICRCRTANNGIYLNGEKVVTYKGDVSSDDCYDYTVTGDVEITYGGSMSVSGGGPSGPTYSYSATIRITEL